MPPVSHDYCEGARPLHFSRPAILAMGRDDMKQVSDHNCIGKKLCDWQVDCGDLTPGVGQ